MKRSRPVSRATVTAVAVAMTAAILATIILAGCAPGPGPGTERQSAADLNNQPLGAGGQPVSVGKPVSAAKPARRIMKEKWHELAVTGDWNMDLQLIRLLSAVWHGMGDIGEILDTASRVRGGSELSWYREWFTTAERVAGMAEASLAGDHRVSAGEAFLRASNYYRAADFYLHADPKDDRARDASRKSVACYGKAVELLGLPIQRVRIPYEGTTLPGWFFRSPKAGNKAGGKAPVIIAIQGYDGTAEETQYVGLEAVKRGYHCLIFEGPGQGQALREQGLKFRPDWEKVIGPTVDFVSAMPEVDAGRIAVLGISFGGSFVIRAAAYEHRPRVYIANPGYIDIAEVFFERVDRKLVNLYEEDPSEFNQKMEDAMKYAVAYRWFLNDGMWKFGVGTPAELVRALKGYDNRRYIDRITSTVLVMDGTEEIAGAGQAKRLYDALKCPKDYLLFTPEDTASLHCQNGSLSVGTMKMFDWLDDRL